ncbi:MAG: glycosyltransferase [Lactobacillus gasseri]|nr:glycosyltransferase [Lactobacillus gasseri]
MNSKKLLVVGDFISGSGLTQFIFNVFPYFDKKKLDIQCVGYGIDSKQETNIKCKKLGWHLDRVIPVTKNPLKHVKWWEKFFKKNDFDYIYFNYSSSWNYMPLKLARRYTNAKIICHSHNSYYSHSFSNKMLMFLLDKLNSKGQKIFNKKADLKIATSKNSALWMFNTLDNVTIVNNGIELEDFKFDNEARKKLRDKLNIADNDKLFGFAGVLQDRKNPIFAVNVFATYVKKNPKSYLLIIGKGPLKAKIEEVSKELKIDDKIKFITYTNELNKWYSALDILIFPSLYEGFGLVPLEAQVSNLLVLASDKVAPQVFVTKNINKISNFDKDTWDKVLENLKFKTVQQREGIDYSLEKFDVKRQAAEISNLLESEK